MKYLKLPQQNQILYIQYMQLNQIWKQRNNQASFLDTPKIKS